VIAVGLFADGTYGSGWNGVDGAVKGLFYGDASQLVAQLVGVATLLVWAFGVGYAFFRVQNRIQPIRVSEAEELAGLDEPLMGALGYPEFATVTRVPESPNGNGLTASKPVEDAPV
jgi:Amt family ammonium transporter